jgi:hypothetical protein
MRLADSRRRPNGGLERVADHAVRCQCANDIDLQPSPAGDDCDRNHHKHCRGRRALRGVQLDRRRNQPCPFRALTRVLFLFSMGVCPLSWRPLSIRNCRPWRLSTRSAGWPPGSPAIRGVDRRSVISRDRPCLLLDPYEEELAPRDWRQPQGPHDASIARDLIR